MIEAFVGLIGGGKTFSAVARIAEYVASGGVVCTNIELMLDPWFNYRYADKLKRNRIDYPVDAANLHYEENHFWANAGGFRQYLLDRFQWELKPGQIIDLKSDQISGNLHEYLPAGTADKPVLVVIDEAVDWFDSEDRAEANREFLTFLRYSRKLCIDIIMIAQEFTELNKRIRNQVQWVWTFKDLGTERIPVLRTRYPVPWRHNIACAQWSGRRWGKDAEEPVRLEMRWKDQRIFGCYRTEELFREVKVLRDVKTDYSNEGKLNQRSKKKMNKFERLMLAASIVVSCCALFRPAGAAVLPSGSTADPDGSSQQTAGIDAKALAALIAEIEEKVEEEYYISYVSDASGKGCIKTNLGQYRNGERHKGNYILRIVESGYMYMDESGELKYFKFKPQPKRINEEEKKRENTI